VHIEYRVIKSNPILNRNGPSLQRGTGREQGAGGMALHRLRLLLLLLRLRIVDHGTNESSLALLRRHPVDATRRDICDRQTQLQSVADSRVLSCLRLADLVACVHREKNHCVSVIERSGWSGGVGDVARSRRHFAVSPASLRQRWHSGS